MLWMVEPRIDLPDEIQEDDEGPRKVVLEESDATEVRRRNWIKGDVELGGEAEEVHDGADVRPVDSKCGSKGEFVDAVAIEFPAKHS